MFLRRTASIIVFCVLLNTCLFSCSLMHYAFEHVDRFPNVVATYLNYLKKTKNNNILLEIANFYLEASSLYNIKETNKMFEFMARNGDARGYKGLADSYFSGQGVRKNLLLAYVLYEKSSKMGYGPAQFNLAILYRDGMGCQKSFKKSCYWLKKAFNNKTCEDLKSSMLDIMKTIKGCNLG